MARKIDEARAKFYRATAIRAEREARKVIDLIPRQEIDGLGWGFKIKGISMKNLVKHVSHASKQVVALHTKPIQFMKLAVTNPAKAIKYAQKEATGLARQTEKVIKQVAPYAAAGAVIYFGGPYALQAIQAAGGIGGAMSATGSALLSGARAYLALNQLQSAELNRQYAQAAAEDPGAAEQLQTLPPDQLLASPMVQNAATRATQYRVEQETGVNMYSPEAIDLLSAHVNDVARGGIDAYLNNSPTPPGMADITVEETDLP